MKKNRILVLIDGFNYYHKLKKYQQDFNKCVKWLDYRSLIESFLNINDDQNNMEIYYFSALAVWRGADAVKRHRTYIKALEKRGIIPVYGMFKKKFIRRCCSGETCSNCTCTPDSGKLIRHEEKNSDVNLAITLIEKTIKDEYDKCFILSADNDFASAIKRAKEIAPSKTIIIQPPPLPKHGRILKREYAIDNLEKCAGSMALLTNFYTIIKHQFPDSFEGLNNPWEIQP